MKLISRIVVLSVLFLSFQRAWASDGPQIYDNYTIQRLIILDDKNQILLERNPAGWMTPSLRSNKEISTISALQALASSMGMHTSQPSLAAIYMYLFDGLPDHKGASFRQHYVARFISGDLTQPVESRNGPVERKWFSIQEAKKVITMEPLKSETFQVIEHPDTLWGATYLLSFKDGDLESLTTVEDFYPVRSQQ